ncbi:hypothetical protein [Chitinimonas sp. BJB300]|uniref:hypothetical protein n=1 Tax=Chitinimonas sp. BJB300 TaxID=1559339 RepID=UPI000C0C78D6|nr:hypothetical protein [Chitinimonas sp. BJB300]PHV09638.1 hypothetical protein CSQ89_20585 [Chitinimonas sp. BJB300]TSJ84556.1 hypothetical protein FG002_019685 [Chitinimonas sp. BJB300]
MITRLLPWPYRLVALSGLGLVLTGFAYLRGRLDEQASQAEENLAGLVRVVALERQQIDISQQVAIAHEQGRARDRILYKTIEKEIIRYVANPDHTACRLDRGWVQQHDAAALSTLPDAPSSVDATASDLTSDDALVAITGNYAACQDNARQLRNLQGWIVQQSQTNPTD